MKGKKAMPMKGNSKKTAPNMKKAAPAMKKGMSSKKMY